MNHGKKQMTRGNGQQKMMMKMDKGQGQGKKCASGKCGHGMNK